MWKEQTEKVYIIVKPIMLSMYVICYNESLIQWISTFFLESMIDNGQKKKIKLKHTDKDKGLLINISFTKKRYRITHTQLLEEDDTISE